MKTEVQFFKEINDLMFEGDLKKGIPAGRFQSFHKNSQKTKGN